jgi:DNA recombination protein RmuC
MEIILFITGFVAGCAIVVFFKAKAAARLTELEKIILEQNQKIKDLEEQNHNLLIYKGRFEQAESTIADLKLQNQNQQNQLQKKQDQIGSFETQNELLKQSQANLEAEKQEWRAQKEKILFQLSEELIRKNNEEQSKFGKNQEEKISKITEDLFKNFENVLNKVSSLGDDVKKSAQDIDLTKNALLNPSGVGKTSEITLENILSGCGLLEKSDIKDVGDYILQSHFLAEDSSARKPDALVFLPNNHTLIIDSKSSIFFLELQKAKEAGDEALQEKIKISLKDRMRKHLDDLKKRNYAKAKEFDILKQNSGNGVFTTVMFLQTEKMLDIVRDVDGSFERKALEAGVWVLSPVGLYNLLSQAKLTIDRVKQEQNIEVLRVEVKKLIESIDSLFKKAQDVGKSASKSLKSYNDFAKTFNSRFLVRVGNLGKMGIESDKKIANNKLEKYNFISDENIIDLQIEDDSKDDTP